jgi:hypothetical protein
MNIKKSDINTMKQTGKVKLFGREVFWHYSVVPFLLFIPILTLWYIIQFYLGIYTGNRTIFELLDGFLFIIPAILFYYIQKKHLTFKKYNISVTEEIFDLAFDKTASELGWLIEIKRKEFIRAHRGWKGESSWGELITIIRDKDTIYINSICDPNAIFASVISYGWNKRNIHVFINNLKKIAESKSEFETM